MFSSPSFWIRIAALLCIVFLEAYAMNQGINGGAFAAAMAAIGAIAGTTIKPLAQIFKSKKPDE